MAAILYIGMIAGALLIAYLLLYRAGPAIAQMIWSHTEARRKHRERLELLEKTTDLVAVLTYDDEVGRQVRVALNKHYAPEEDDLRARVSVVEEKLQQR